MIAITTFAGKRVAVFGMARSGLAAAKALVAGGAEVACWDDAAKGRAAAEAAGLPLVDLNTANLSQFSALVLSPGVPLTNPKPLPVIVVRARAANIPIIGDTWLFFRELGTLPEKSRPKVVGITGTNGKSTTTALTAHLLRHAGRRVAMGGNIGEAVLGLAPFAETDVYVLELSSYQIDLTWRPEDGVDPGVGCDVGILLNLSTDHIDRHGSFEHYAAVKERLVATARAALVGNDDPFSRAIAHRYLEHDGWCEAIHIADDPTRPASAVSRADVEPFKRANILHTIDAAHAEALTTAVLRGPHNVQNATAAVETCMMLRLDGSTLKEGLRTFPGLAHRMELLGLVGAIAYVNDSKATNADSTAKALNSFGSGLHWIAGGKAKDGGIESLAPFFGNVAHAYLIGEASEAFAATLAKHLALTIHPCGTVARAVGEAARVAGAGPATVLLSPACASFDQFKDFEDRGDQFRKLVQALPGFVPYSAKGGT